jgi:AGZA family xanthine/uracil permease-like MFS transporter
MLILKGLPLLVAKISNNRLVPGDFERREIWQKPAGGFAPLWMRRLASGDKRFWLPKDDIPAALPTHTKETDSRSSNGKVAKEVVPLHSPPPAGLPHPTDEDPHDEKHDI